MKPRIEPVRITKSAQIQPCPQKCVLHTICREVVVAEDQTSRGIQPVGAPGRQHGEGVGISALSPDHQVVLHLGLGLQIIGLSGVSTESGTWAPETVP